MTFKIEIRGAESCRSRRFPSITADENLFDRDEAHTRGPRERETKMERGHTRSGSRSSMSAPRAITDNAVNFGIRLILIIRGTQTTRDLDVGSYDISVSTAGRCMKIAAASSALAIRNNSFNAKVCAA